MSHFVRFIITTPEEIEEACAGWPRGLKEPRQGRRRDPATGELFFAPTYVPEHPPPAPPGVFQRGMEAIEQLGPVNEVRKNFVPPAIWDRARAVFVGYDADDVADDPSRLGFVMRVVRRVDDADVDELLDDRDEWAAYTREMREAQGLGVYLIYLH